MSIEPGQVGEHLIGAVLTHAVRPPGGGVLRKGKVIGPEDVLKLAQLDRQVHVVVLDSHDVHEDDAAGRLANLVVGAGLRARPPVQSRVNIEVTQKGLIRVNAPLVDRINSLAPIGLFTMLDRVPVVPGKIVAGVKIATIAVDASVLGEAETLIASSESPPLELRPFLPHRVAVVVTEMPDGRIRDRFEASVRQKIAWYGSEIQGIAYLAADSEVVASAIDAMVEAGANLVLVAGGNMMDPLDPTLVAMDGIGASVVRLGAPAHPGSMFWLGHIPAIDLPVLNLASCSMYSRSTVADLVLPWVMAGEAVTEADIAGLGYGGLLDRSMGWRFPDYQSDSVDEPDEE
ncbi:MAG TPA: hypothetical protein VD767_07345 [Thermomicrobiales bacterium]|nr:hypothetical protein [Thermomicrobiales bacterium]